MTLRNQATGMRLRRARRRPNGLHFTSEIQLLLFPSVSDGYSAESTRSFYYVGPLSSTLSIGVESLSTVRPANFDLHCGFPDCCSMTETLKPVTKWLRAWSSGDAAASQELFPVIYKQLRLLAQRHFRSERPGHTLSATALVHEAYLNLVDANVAWQDRAHFFAISANIMRRILVDHAKRRLTQKRGGGASLVSLDEALVIANHPDPRIVLIDEALDQLAKLDARKAQVFELSFFGGMTLQEISGAIGGSSSALHRDLQFAKAWMLHAISS